MLQEENWHFATILLGLPERARPSQMSIDHTYINAINDNSPNIANFLTPHISQHLNRPLNNENNRLASPTHGRSRSYEIHKYTQHLISTDGKQQTVLELVLKRIKELLDDEDILKYEQALTLIASSVKRLGKHEDQSVANVLKYLHIADENIKEIICIVATFAQKHYHNKIDMWINGFVIEAAKAYEEKLSPKSASRASSSSSAASTNTTSCSKGVEERIITGLRDLGDEDLNEIFKFAEKDRADFLKANNILNSKFISNTLKNAGFNKNSDEKEIYECLKNKLSEEFPNNPKILELAMRNLDAVSDILLDFMGE